MNNPDQIIKKYGKTFYWASFFLEKKIKSRLFLIYSFCRRIDDLVDSNGNDSNKNIAKSFNKNIKNFFKQEKKLYPSKEILNQFISGQQSDLSHKQPKSIDDLIIYCYKVAGVVGLMVCDALEVRDKKIRYYAIDLGIAMQLTNICRDIKEDSNMGRVYLPVSLVGKLKAKDITVPNKDIFKKIEICQNKLLKLADDYYASADFAIPFLPGKTSFAIRIASKLYQAIGKKIIKQKISYLNNRVFINKYEKLKITFYNLFFKNNSFTKLESHNMQLHNAIKDLPGANRFD